MCDTQTAEIVDALDRFATQVRDHESEPCVIGGLATAARMMARQRDAIAEASADRIFAFLDLPPSEVDAPGAHTVRCGLLDTQAGSRFAESLGHPKWSATGRLGTSTVSEEMR